MIAVSTLNIHVEPERSGSRVRKGSGACGRVEDRIDDDGRGFRQVGHTGGMPGVTTVLSLFPAERVVIVVLANGRSDLIVPLARRVAGAVIPGYAWRLRQELR